MDLAKRLQHHKNLTSFKFEPTTLNMSQLIATRCNMVAKRAQHVASNNVALCFVEMLRSFGLGLSHGQTIATCQHNMSQHCRAQHVGCVWPPFCDVLRHVGCRWIKFDHFQIRANNTQHVATHHNTVAKCTQHVEPNNVAICCVDML